MHGAESAEEAACPPECFVNELIDDNQVTRGDLIDKRSDGPAANHCMYAKLFKGKDISRERHNTWRKFMSLAVTIQKCDVPFAEPSDQNRRARLAEGCIDVVKLRINDTLGQCIAQARAAYYTN
jgi:hypothetical protein